MAKARPQDDDSDDDVGTSVENRVARLLFRALNRVYLARLLDRVSSSTDCIGRHLKELLLIKPSTRRRWLTGTILPRGEHYHAIQHAFGVWDTPPTQAERAELLAEAIDLTISVVRHRYLLDRGQRQQGFARIRRAERMMLEQALCYPRLHTVLACNLNDAENKATKAALDGLFQYLTRVGGLWGIKQSEFAACVGRWLRAVFYYTQNKPTWG